MRTNFLPAKDILLLENQQLHKSSGDFDQKQNQSALITSNVKPFSASKMPKEGYHFRYINPTEVKNSNPVHQYSAPKRINTTERSENSRIFASQVNNEYIVKGDSCIKYVPYEKKVIQYEDRSFVQKVPVKRKVVKYEEKKVIEKVPHEIVEQNYYAVQTRVQYLKEIIPQKKIEMVPIQRKIKRYEYLPVERQIVHYPSNFNEATAQQQTKSILKHQTASVSNHDEFDTINTMNTINNSIIYTYTTRRGMRDNRVGTGDQKKSRLVSQNVIPPSPKVKSKQLGSWQNDGFQPSILSPQKFSSQSKNNQYTAKQLFIYSQLNLKSFNDKKVDEVIQTFHNQKSQLDSKYELNKIESMTTYLLVHKQVGDSVIVEDGDKK